MGNECFENVGELIMTGLSELESMVVGERSFTKNSAGNDDSLKLCLKNCPKLRDLSIGSGSFSDYRVGRDEPGSGHILLRFIRVEKCFRLIWNDG